MTFKVIPPHTSTPFTPCTWLKLDEGCYWCCDDCNMDQHICPGCGKSLTHHGKEIIYLDGAAASMPVYREHKCSTLEE